MKVLIVVALAEELPFSRIPEGFYFLCTGAGKANAAISLSKYFCCSEKNIDLVVNYGTAGALNKELKAGLYEVSKIYQRDVDLTALGLEQGQMLGEQLSESVLEISSKGITLGTGDSFVIDSPSIMTDAVDMEAYALAKACKTFGKRFKCFKYISDFADSNAADDWSTQIDCGAEHFLKHMKDNYEDICKRRS